MQTFLQTLLQGQREFMETAGSVTVVSSPLTKTDAAVFLAAAVPTTWQTNIRCV